ncbi:Hypothetical protein SCF082_LOCUS21417, partial [Durusdinium trenchii]
AFQAHAPRSISQQQQQHLREDSGDAKVSDEASAEALSESESESRPLEEDHGGELAPPFRLSEEDLEGMDAVEMMDFLVMEAGSLSKLLRIVKGEYDAFCQAQDVVMPDAVPETVRAKSELIAKQVDQGHEEDEQLARHSSSSSSNNNNNKSQTEEDQTRPNHPTQRKALPMERHLRTTLKDYHLKQGREALTHYQVNIDWDQVRACSSSLRGVLQVIPIYTKAFDKLAKVLARSRPQFSSLLLRVWRGYLQLLLLVVRKTQLEINFDVDFQKLVDDTHNLTAEFDLHRKSLQQAASQIGELELRREALAKTLDAKESALINLVDEERQLLAEAGEVEQDIVVAEDAVASEAQKGAAIDDVAASGTGRIAEDGEHEDHDGSQGDSDDADRESESANSMAAQKGFKSPALFASPSTAPQKQVTSDGIFMTDMLLSGTRGLGSHAEGGSGDDNDSASSDSDFGGGIGSFGAQEEETEEAEIADELAKLNNEIQSVEEAARAQREARERTRALERRQKMIKVADVALLKELFTDIKALKTDLERQHAASNVLVKTKRTSRVAAWENSENATPSSSPKKGAKSVGSTTRKKQPPELFRRGAPKRKDGAVGSQAVAIDLSKSGLPPKMLAVMQTASSGKLEFPAGRKSWSLGNVGRVINRVHAVMLNERRKPSAKSKRFADYLYSVFEDEYGDAVERELVSFLMGVSRFKNNQVGPSLFWGLCEKDQRFEEEFYQILSVLTKGVTLVESSHDHLWYMPFGDHLDRAFELIMPLLGKDYDLWPGARASLKTLSWEVASSSSDDRMIGVHDVMMFVVQGMF